MKTLTTFLLAVSMLILYGCNAKDSRSVAPQGVSSRAEKANAQATQPRTQSQSAASEGLAMTIGARDAQVSLDEASAVQAASMAADRKIIRNADLTIETDSPTDGLRKITSIAEGHGGFVVTSEFKQNDSSGQAMTMQNVTVVARVPSPQFSGALEQIRAAGIRVIQEKVSGQDVSEEYLDLEARIRTKKALEAQFLEIMKQARKVSEALEVQSQLADVRTEIERLEGRRRFLENQAALLTITATLQMPAPLVAATTIGFGHSIKQAFGDAVDTSASIILFVIQTVIVLVPIGLLVVLPVWLLWRALRRRFEWTKKTAPVAESQ